MFVILPRPATGAGGPDGPVPLAKLTDLEAVRAALPQLARDGHGDDYVVVTLGACTPRHRYEVQMWNVRQPVGMPRPLGYMPPTLARPWVLAARQWVMGAAA